MITFILDDRIANSSMHILDLELCDVRLKNNKNYPWLILIPRVENTITEIFQLNVAQQNMLISDITHTSRIIHSYFQPNKLNVGALGNIVSQLHIHMIARFQKDSLWPQGVWHENLQEIAYPTQEKENLVKTLRALLL